MAQFPASFQFNSNLLIFLLDALYSCQFGNFLCDNEKEREEASVQQETTSIWTYVMLNQSEFTNVFYRPNPHVLVPNCSRARMIFWAEYYLRWSPARPQYLVEQQHYMPAGEAYQLFAVPRPSSSSSSSAPPTTSSSADPPLGEGQSEDSPTSTQETTEPRRPAAVAATAEDAAALTSDTSAQPPLHQNETP